jgi:hypothetical protein
MSHDVFTRKDALRQDIPMSSPPTPEMEEAVRRLAASQSESADECVMFLDMLGIPQPKREVIQ